MNKKIFSIIMLGLLITGCTSGTKNSNVVCKKSETMFGFDVDNNVTLKSTNDEVDKYISTSTYKVSSVISKDRPITYYEKSITNMYSQLKGVKGVTIKITKTKEKNIEVKVTIDYTKVDTKKLKDTGFLTSKTSASTKQIKSELKKNKYKCK